MAHRKYWITGPKNDKGWEDRAQAATAEAQARARERAAEQATAQETARISATQVAKAEAARDVAEHATTEALQLAQEMQAREQQAQQATLVAEQQIQVFEKAGESQRHIAQFQSMGRSSAPSIITKYLIGRKFHEALDHMPIIQADRSQSLNLNYQDFTTEERVAFSEGAIGYGIETVMSLLDTGEMDAACALRENIKRLQNSLDFLSNENTSSFFLEADPDVVPESSFHSPTSLESAAFVASAAAAVSTAPQSNSLLFSREGSESMLSWVNPDLVYFPNSPSPELAVPLNANLRNQVLPSLSM